VSFAAHDDLQSKVVLKDEGNFASEAHSCLDFEDANQGGLSVVFGGSDTSFPKLNCAKTPLYDSRHTAGDLQELGVCSLVLPGS